MKIQVCKRCGKKHYPFKARCYCGSIEFEYKDADVKGKLLTITKIYITPKGFPSPLIAGLVASDDMKLIVRLEKEAPIGSIVEIEQNSDGVLIGRTQ